MEMLLPLVLCLHRTVFFAICKESGVGVHRAGYLWVTYSPWERQSQVFRSLILIYTNVEIIALKKNKHVAPTIFLK